MKKLVMSMLVMAMVVGAVGGSAVAAFVDVETSTDNSFTAGTLDLKTNDADGVTKTLYATSMKAGPEHSIGPATIVLKNYGSIDAPTLDLQVSYVEDDGSPNPVNKTADETAAVIKVDTLDYGGSSLLPSVPDWNGNTYKDIEDLKHADLTGLPGIGGGSQTKDFVVKITLNTTDNDFQGDGIDIDFTFTLSQ